MPPVISSTVVPLSTIGSASHTNTSRHSKPFISRLSMDSSSTGTLSFHNINYTVGGTSTQCVKCCPCIKPKPGKQILYDVSGIFTTGMNAIMGKIVKNA